MAIIFNTELWWAFWTTILLSFFFKQSQLCGAQHSDGFNLLRNEQPNWPHWFIIQPSKGYVMSIGKKIQRRRRKMIWKSEEKYKVIKLLHFDYFIFLSMRMRIFKCDVERCFVFKSCFNLKIHRKWFESFSFAFPWNLLNSFFLSFIPFSFRA